MGPPPNYLITRKLVRHFFRKYLPKEPVSKNDAINELQNTIMKHGMDHPSTMMAIDKVDQAEDEARQYRQKLQNLKIQQRVMSALNKPHYPFNQKGRFRSDLYMKQWTIYDGIK